MAVPPAPSPANMNVCSARSRPVSGAAASTPASTTAAVPCSKPLRILFGLGVLHSRVLQLQDKHARQFNRCCAPVPLQIICHESAVESHSDK